jgi:probable rRNA maturation factor
MSARAESILIQRCTPPLGIPAAVSLRRWAQAAIGRARGALTIRVVGEDESRALNRRYRGKDKPTNVLSFPAPASPAEPLLGDLVICAPVVTREAREQSKTARAHWAHMVVHGCLHLLDYDHENERDARRMESRERELLAGFGFADPYLAERG